MTDFALKDGATFLGLIPVLILFSPSCMTAVRIVKLNVRRTKRVMPTILTQRVMSPLGNCLSDLYLMMSSFIQYHQSDHRVLCWNVGYRENGLLQHHHASCVIYMTQSHLMRERSKKNRSALLQFNRNHSRRSPQT